tara:strand:- start:254 stop:1228 length:975 start_codon:yes stop_codon:yes gene_type:complete
MNSKIRAGIVGGAGYAGGELIRLLTGHPNVEVQWVLSQSQNGKKIHEIHHDLLGWSDLTFQNEMTSAIDALFICSGHGKSKAFLDQNKIDEHVVIIDLSRDFRLKSEEHDYVYGLCELNKEQIKKSNKIANCGCFASCIQIGLLPAAKEGWLKSDIHVNAITGSTGAGQSKLDTTHFSWRNNNISIYKAFKHQHLGEILQSISQEDQSFDSHINFLPVRGDFSRGIYASMYFNCEVDIEMINETYRDYYKNSPFVHITSHNPSLKEVVNTNMNYIHLERIDNKLLIISMLDNLVKGAAGQAVQNMNIVFDLEEDAGLQLKASVY